MQQEDTVEKTLAEPVITYYNGQKNTEPYFFDPLDDVGFKRLFAAQQNADLTISFINLVLEGKRMVTAIEVLKNEYPGETRDEGGIVIDLVCKDQHGSFFLLEMQRQYQKNFRDRSLFYGSKLIVEQAPRGNRKHWAYALKDVYVISLLETFSIDTKNKDLWMHHIGLVDVHSGRVFNNRLAFTYIELSNFNKPESDLKSALEQWIYALKNLNQLTGMPAVFTAPELVQFCEAARYINLTKQEKDMISNRTKNRWDYYSVMQTARETGEEEGRAIGEASGKAQGQHEKAIMIAIKLKNRGASTEEIHEITELGIHEIEVL